MGQIMLAMQTLPFFPTKGSVVVVGDMKSLNLLSPSSNGSPTGLLLMGLDYNCQPGQWPGLMGFLEPPDWELLPDSVAASQQNRQNRPEGHLCISSARLGNPSAFLWLFQWIKDVHFT